MYKKLLIGILALVGTIFTMIGFNHAIKAETSSGLYQTSWNTFAKVKVGDTFYTATKRDGGFLADQVVSQAKVDYETPLPVIQDSRNANLFTTSYASKQDLVEVLLDNELDDTFPKQETWWLKDTATINSIDSAYVVNENNRTNEEEYVVNNYIWNGALPIVDYTPYKTMREKYPNVEGDWINFYGAYRTYYVCPAKFEGGEVLPCGEDNPERAAFLEDNLGFLLGKVTQFNDETRTIHIETIAHEDLRAGDLVYIHWYEGTKVSEFGYGNGLFVMGPSTDSQDYSGVTLVGPYVDMSWGGTSNPNLDGEIVNYLEEPIEKQQATQRPYLIFDNDEVAYVHEEGESYSVSSVLSTTFPTSIMSSDKVNYVHAKDTSLNITGMHESSENLVYVDAASQKLYIPEGTPSVKLPIVTPLIQEGYSRYISVIATNTSGQNQYGKIAQLGRGGEVEVSLDLTGLLEDTADIEVYVEDVKLDGTSYISEPYIIHMESYIPTEIAWKQNKPYISVVSSVASESVGKLSVSGGIGTVSLAMGNKHADDAYFQINASGIVSLKQAIPVSALQGHQYNESVQAYEMNVTFVITQNGESFEYPVVVYVQGVQRDLAFAEENEQGQIVKTFAENGTFYLSLTEPLEGVVYQLQEDQPSDVIQVLQDGETTILHANETSVEGYQAEQVYVEAIVPASDGYMGTTVQAEVLIQRAKQTLSFAKNPINTTSDVSKLNIRVNGHKDSKDLLYETKDQSISISADPSDTDQAVIETHGVVKDGIELRVKAQGDRDYLPTDETSEGKATLNIRKPGEKPFKAVFPDMTYGDTGPFKVVMEPAANADITYEYDVQPKGIIDIDEGGNITIHNAGSVSVDIIQHTKDGEIGPYSYDLTVKPRELVIEIDDKTMQVGTAVPEFTYQITSGNIVAGDDLGDFIFDCKDTEGRPVDEQSEAGSYDITGNYQNQNGNYNITVHKGTLTITQDHIDSSWMHLETADGQRYNSVWTNQNVYLVSDNTTYPQISLDKQVWDTRPEVSSEGNHTYDFWMKSTSGAITSKGVTSAIKIDKTDPVINDIRVLQASRNAYESFMNTISFGMLYGNQKVVQVQAIDPNLGSVNEVSNIAEITYTLQKLDANLLPEGNPTTGKLSGSDREISVSGSGMYEVCAIAYDHAGNTSSEHCKQVDLGMDESIDSNQNGCQDLNIEMPDGSILNEDVNGDGIPELNIDTDLDGKADINIDSDGDRKPDINVVSLTKWEPDSTCSIVDGVQYETMLNISPVINIDIDNDYIPDLNIDNDGDLKGDLNISKDGKTPSINITTIHTWNPHTDYTHAGFTYDSIGTKVDDPKPELNIDSDEDGRPDINIDLDNDGIPDLNIDKDYDNIPDLDIDSDGDGIPDSNVDTDQDGYADENIVDIPEWKPEMNVDGEFPYDTMPNLKPKEDNELEDGGIIVENPDGIFTSDYQLKVEVITDTIDTAVKEAIMGYVEEDEEIKEVYDVILLKDNVRVQPDGTLKIKIPVDESILNPKLLVEQKDGTFKEIAVVIEDGYYVFESDYLGKVSIVADIQDNTETTTVPNSNNHAVGGASTGYEDHLWGYLFMLFITGSFLVGILYKKQRA